MEEEDIWLNYTSEIKEVANKLLDGGEVYQGLDQGGGSEHSSFSMSNWTDDAIIEEAKKWRWIPEGTQHYTYDRFELVAGS